MGSFDLHSHAHRGHEPGSAGVSPASCWAERRNAPANATPLINQTICPNQPLLLQTTAISPEPITYLWKYNDQPIAERTNNTLALPFVGQTGGGVYSVEVRTECASLTLRANVTVLPTIEESPASYTNSDSIIISEYGPSVPYGSAVTPQCVPGRVQNVTVHINGYYHNFPSDASMVLVSPDGREVRLMAGAGASEAMTNNVNLTFSDAATPPLPFADEIVSGTYEPTDYQPDLVLPLPAGGPYATNFAAFKGAAVNGPWRLCVYDSLPGDGGDIASWSLDIEWREQELRLWNPRVLASGEFRSEVSGQTGIPTIIEYSANGQTWQPIATNVFDTSPGVFTAPGPLQPNRFYRAVQP